MKRKLPKHGETRTLYPFSLKKRYINDHMIWFERYKLIQRYDLNSHTWQNFSIHLDDRPGIVSAKEEVQTFGGPY